MGKIVISENVSLDGVMQDPTGTEGFRLAGWFDQLGHRDREAWAEVELAEALGAEALLMGRRTYHWFVARGWPSRGGAWADRLRSLPKYVVSSTLEDLGWINSTVLGSDVVHDVPDLARRMKADIVVYGSGRLVHTLLDHDLVDEMRLMVCPFLLGEGERVFGNVRGQRSLRLADTRAVGESLVQLTYQFVRTQPHHKPATTPDPHPYEGPPWSVEKRSFSEQVAVYREVTVPARRSWLR